MIRLAMWSGPRNISTALMRAFENRSDCRVVDEPLYAYYLQATGLDHPGRDEVIASQSTDWAVLQKQLLQGDPDCAVYYQKHMAQHLMPEMGMQWLQGLQNCLLLRDPDYVVASYSKARPEVTPVDLGFAQQKAIYDYLLAETGEAPLVLESSEILKNPKAMLGAICAHFGIEAQAAMFDWPAGKRDSDGVWAPYWYAAVEKSSGFAPYQAREVALSSAQQEVADACRPYYEALIDKRLTLPSCSV